VFALLLVAYAGARFTGFLGALGSGRMDISLAGAALSGLHVLSWNVAAINLNPFEYWITLEENPAYGAMMDGVQAFIDSPGAGDVRIDQIFTPDMFARLRTQMLAVGWSAEHVESTAAAWRADYAERKIVSGFLKDPKLGLKRLVSMPDRYTNTIDLASGEKAYRPSVINCYGRGDLSSVAQWWEAWNEFMFSGTITTVDQKTKHAVTRTVASGLAPISRAKYPAITAAEAEYSLPLQTLTLALFDAILVHIVTELEGGTLSGVGAGAKGVAWQPVREQVCAALNHRKTARTLEILRTPAYVDADVMFLQECASSFVGALRDDAVLGAKFSVIAPATQNKRNQNSLLLLSKVRKGARRAIVAPEWLRRPLAGRRIVRRLTFSAPPVHSSPLSFPRSFPSPVALPHLGRGPQHRALRRSTRIDARSGAGEEDQGRGGRRARHRGERRRGDRVLPRVVSRRHERSRDGGRHRRRRRGALQGRRRRARGGAQRATPRLRPRREHVRVRDAGENAGRDGVRAQLRRARVDVVLGRSGKRRRDAVGAHDVQRAHVPPAAA
jgi:hypothetical protein